MCVQNPLNYPLIYQLMESRQVTFIKLISQYYHSNTCRQILIPPWTPAGTTLLGAAVAQLQGGAGWEHGRGEVQGVVRMVQVAPDTCVVEGTVDGLTPGQHALRIHENGDLSQGCDRSVVQTGVKRRSCNVNN